MGSPFDITYMTKSTLPSSRTHLSTAFCKLSACRTSTAPMPSTLAPCRAVAMSCAMASVLATLRPTMHALAPRETRARTWALQMVPAPPVQKTTLLSVRGGVVRAGVLMVGEDDLGFTEYAFFPHVADEVGLW